MLVYFTTITAGQEFVMNGRTYTATADAVKDKFSAPGRGWKVACLADDGEPIYKLANYNDCAWIESRVLVNG